MKRRKQIDGRLHGVAIAAAYITVFVAANLLITHFGPQSAPITSFVLVGVSLVLRDLAHDRWERNYLWAKMIGLVVASGFISYILNPSAGKIAVASFAAIVASGLLESFVYQINIKRKWIVRSNISNVTGAAVDSFVFAAVAFGINWPIIGLMTLAKVIGGAIWTGAFSRFKVVVILLILPMLAQGQNIQTTHNISKDIRVFTYETFQPTERGNWFGFLDVEHGGNVQELYGELSWTHHGFTLEGNAGANEFWQGGIVLIGYQYRFLRLLWRSDNNPQVTVPWCYRANRYTFSGFVDAWLQNEKVVVLSKPRLWMQFCGHMDAGIGVDVSHGFKGDGGRSVDPVVGVRVRW